MIDVEAFSKAGIGKINEDYVLHTEITPSISVIIVCDGMGGLSYGAVASEIIANSIENFLKKYLSSHTAEQSIISALHYANNELAKESVRLKSKMGASVALVLFIGNDCHYSWLGDVRVYLKRGKHTELLTKDHIAFEGSHYFLSRCINGKKLRYSPEVADMILDSGDEVIIATDGYYLHNNVSTPIQSVCATEDDATIVCIRLS